MKKMKYQMCRHEKTGNFYRVTKHGDYLTDVQKITNIWEDTGAFILPVPAMLFTKELKFYPWVVGDK